MDQITPRPLTVRAIIALWPSRAVLAQDMTTEPLPVTAERINGWAKRGTVPSEYHARLLRAAEVRGIALFASDIVRAHDRSVATDSAINPGEAA